MSAAVTWSRGFGKYDNAPINHEADTFGEFLDIVLADRCTAKHEQWIAGAFAVAEDPTHLAQYPKAKRGKPHRCETCAQSRRWIAHDVDKGLSPEMFHALVEALQPYSGAVYTTASHKPDAPRCRVILELDMAVDRTGLIASAEAMRARIDRLVPGVQWDTSCDRPEQPLYLPPADAWVARLDGEAIVVGALLNECLPAPSPDNPAPKPSPGATNSNTELVAAILRGDELHDSTRNYAFRLIEDGMKPGKVVETVRGVMLNSAARGADAARWQERYDDIPRLVGDAEAKTRKGADAQLTGSLASEFQRLLTPVSDEELEEAKKPHPHAFMRGGMGAFPLRELTIVGAPGREGKTTILMAVLARYALGADLAGMHPQMPRRAVILSAEDDREQYTRKLGAQLEGLTPDEKSRMRERIIFPDLNAPTVREYRQLVAMIERHPKKTPTVDALIEALRPMTVDPIPLGLVVIETASTWNEAAEDNPGQRAIVAAGKDIAQALDVAVILVHHTSQAASSNLPTLEISRNDIRGGTALTDNSRQNWLLVNLGSDAKPLRERDARTALRRAIAPGNPHRIVALICLDSSKSEEPPPVFLQWERSRDYGPRAVEIEAPVEYAGKSWELVRAQLMAERVEAHQEAKDAAREAKVRVCVEAVARLTEEGKQATVRAVSTATGHGADWAAPYLSVAVADGVLACRQESVPRTRGPTDVYRPADSSEADK